MEHLTGLALGILGKLIGTEIEAWVPVIARRLIERAILQLPAPQQERFREEWFSHLEECPGNLGKLTHSIGCVYGACVIAATQSNGLGVRIRGAKNQFMYELGYVCGVVSVFWVVIRKHPTSLRPMLWILLKLAVKRPRPE